MIWGMAATAAAEPSVRPHNAGGESDSLARLHAEVRVGGGGVSAAAMQAPERGAGRDAIRHRPSAYKTLKVI